MADEREHRAAACAGRLRHWLLQGPARVASGPHRGGVAGVVAEDGQPRYVYAEITGYYLHWLSGLATAPDSDAAQLRRNAECALGWLVRSHLARPLPPTRIPLPGGDSGADWRNTTHFCFDLAMLVGGLARAEDVGLISVPEVLWHSLRDALLAFVDRPELSALANGTDASLLPQRWSTLGGDFLAKAGSRIDFAPRRAGIEGPLRDAARTTRDRVAAAAAHAPVGMLHPTLYALEGVLCSPVADWTAAAGWLSRLLAWDPGDGNLPEAPDSPVPRTDVVAQALRVALLLRARGAAGAPDAALVDRLAEALLARVRADGTVPFRSDAPASAANVWCAMFTEQALRWYALASAGHARVLAPEDLV